MRQDMLPAEYCQELTLLRADVSPMPFGEVKEVVGGGVRRPDEIALPLL